MLDSKELNKKYVGKEVISEVHKNARISNLTSYEIEIKADDGCWVYETGTGEKDNAVARGNIKFVDEALQKEFIEEYEQYVNSEEGRVEAWLYNVQTYD